MSDLFIFPLLSFFIAILFVAAYLASKSTKFDDDKITSQKLIIPAVCWSIYTVYETIYYIKYPEMNLRVDLVFIWPALLILTIIGLLPWWLKREK